MVALISSAYNIGANIRLNFISRSNTNLVEIQDSKPNNIISPMHYFLDFMSHETCVRAILFVQQCYSPYPFWYCDLCVLLNHAIDHNHWNILFCIFANDNSFSCILCAFFALPIWWEYDFRWTQNKEKEHGIVFRPTHWSFLEYVFVIMYIYVYCCYVYLNKHLSIYLAHAYQHKQIELLSWHNVCENKISITLSSRCPKII